MPERRATYRLTFRDAGTEDGPTPTQRIRRLLKNALKAYDYRCIDIEELLLDDQDSCKNKLDITADGE